MKKDIREVISQTKIMLGNKARISIDERDKKKYVLSYQILNNEVPIEVIIFNHDSDAQKNFIRQKPVIFLLNGQTQGIETRTFISQDLGFRALRDHMLICVDCTNVKLSFRQDLFMSSRDRMKQGSNYDYLKQEIMETLKNDDNLKKINQEYKGRILHESQDDKDLIEKLFSNLKGNREIRALFTNPNGEFAFASKKKKEEKIKALDEKQGKEQKKIFKRFPSYFRIKGLEDKDGRKIKMIPKGGKGIIVFETDVENEYFTRNIDQGDLEIKLLDYKKGSGQGGVSNVYPSTIIDTIKVQRSGPFDGEIKLMLEPTGKVDVGDIFTLSINMTSPAGDMQVIVWVGTVKKISQIGCRLVAGC